MFKDPVKLVSCVLIAVLFGLTLAGALSLEDWRSDLVQRNDGRVPEILQGLMDRPLTDAHDEESFGYRYRRVDPETGNCWQAWPERALATGGEVHSLSWTAGEADHRRYRIVDGSLAPSGDRSPLRGPLHQPPPGTALHQER